MNKKFILAISIAVIIPVISYFIVKWKSEEAIVMPRKYLLDSVVTYQQDGRSVSDSIWHKTANFSLVNQLGDTVHLYDINNRVIVANYFFTRCPTICPSLTRNMARLQQSFSHYRQGRKVIDSSIVRFISFSVDPERDSVAALKRYADRYAINHDNWWLLTGNKKDIYNFALNEIKIPVVDGENVDSSFIHTSRFILMDKDYVIRGYYDGLDTAALSNLARDIGLLMLEKDKTQKRNLFRK